MVQNKLLEMQIKRIYLHFLLIFHDNTLEVSGRISLEHLILKLNNYDQKDSPHQNTFAKTHLIACFHIGIHLNHSQCNSTVCSEK